MPDEPEVEATETHEGEPQPFDDLQGHDPDAEAEILGETEETPPPDEIDEGPPGHGPPGGEGPPGQGPSREPEPEES